MTEIGVRELKTKTSQIVRNVRKRRARYVVTYRGRPVAMITPLESPAAADARAAPALPEQVWAELTRLGQSIAESWPAGVTSADVLSEMRR